MGLVARGDLGAFYDGDKAMTESDGYITGMQYARGLLTHEQYRLLDKKEKARSVKEVEDIDAQLRLLETLRGYLTTSIKDEMRRVDNANS